MGRCRWIRWWILYNIHLYMATKPMRCDEMSSFSVVRFCRFRKTSQVQILMNSTYLVEEGDFDKKTRSALKGLDATHLRLVHCF